jgi:hypothetical protein
MVREKGFSANNFDIYPANIERAIHDNAIACRFYGPILWLVLWPFF